MAKQNANNMTTNIQPGVGLDCGTMNFVSARKSGQKVNINRIRDAFVELDSDKKKFLKLSNTDYIDMGGKLLVLGDSALETANIFNKEVKRPMSGGVIASGEMNAQQIIGLMMKEILGEPLKEKEKCAYSVPAIAIDVVNSDINYHRMILGKIIEELGYDPVASNEAQAIVLAECAKDQFSGLGISYGAGMTNVSLCYNAMSTVEFSVGRGGDWVDMHSAKAVNKTIGKITSIKEDGIDIFNPQDRDAEAISLYLRSLIDYTIDNIITHFNKSKDEISLPKPVPLVIGGGTSMAHGFIDLFKSRFELVRNDFPVRISEIRQAEDPLHAVAVGLVLAAQIDD